MKSCNRKILDLFYNANHAGRIIKPEAIGRVGGNDDGLVIELSWRVANETIVDAKFRAFGNPNAIAITSLMTDSFIGKTIEEAMNVDESVIFDTLEEMKPEYLEVYDMVCLAREDAYQYYLKHKDKHISSEDNEVKLDLINDVESEDLTQEEIDKRIEQTIQHEVMSEFKAGRGRPRKERLEGEEVVVGEKRGRGRPKKERSEEELQAIALSALEKRGRGRPKKERTEEELLALANAEKRGRGRPRKERTEGEEVVVGEKRGRGRPKKERSEEELQAIALSVSEKRGRGRPKKERTEEELLALANVEKRGRGRPRKEKPEGEEVVVGEKRGRGRPRKSEPVKINFPKSDLDEVITDEVVEQLISGTSNEKRAKEELDNDNFSILDNIGLGNDSNTNKEEIDYFKSISNLNANYFNTSSNDNVTQANELEVNDKSNNNVDEDIVEKRGRGRPRKEHIQIEVIGEKRGRGRPKKEYTEEELQALANVEKKGRGRPRKERPEGEEVVVGEKRGRGRPKKENNEEEPQVLNVEENEKRGRGRPRKEVVENNETANDEKRGRGRPKKDEITTPTTPINSLTRSLTVNGSIGYHSTQDIVFASKNVTITNINSTKVTNEKEEKVVSNEYTNPGDINNANENTTILNSKETSPSYIEELDTIDKSNKNLDDKLVNDFSKDKLLSETNLENDKELEDLYDTKFDDIEDDFDDEDEEIDTSNIKDEAPKGGIEDLLKALLEDK